MPYHTLNAQHSLVTLDLGVGHIASLELGVADSAPLKPLHRAPWADAPAGDFSGVPALERYLSGDFLCAPFGPSDIDNGPAHGWSANSEWRLVDEIHNGACHSSIFHLARKVFGATLHKNLTLIDGHSFLYQSHSFSGGQGALPVAHHAMVHLAGTGSLSTSPKAFAQTPTDWNEPAKILTYPGQSEDLSRFPGAGGYPVDLTHLPFGKTNEDFVMLVEAAPSDLGWSALSRHSEGDVVLLLKNAHALPVTMIWNSNGGRQSSPWNGRHRGVVGIEDGICYSLFGHQASITPNPLNALGTPTAIQLVPDGSVKIRHVIGAFKPSIPVQRVTDVECTHDTLTVHFNDGKSQTLPFDGTFLSSTG